MTLFRRLNPALHEVPRPQVGPGPLTRPTAPPASDPADGLGLLPTALEA